MQAEKKYYRINDMARRYGVSRSKLLRMVDREELPAPMILAGLKVWPVELLDELDRLRNEDYYEEVLG